MFNSVKNQLAKRTAPQKRANYAGAGDEIAIGKTPGPYIAGQTGASIGRGYADQSADVQARLSRAETSFTLVVSNSNTAAGVTDVTLFGSNSRSDANIGVAGTNVTVTPNGTYDYATILRQMRTRPLTVLLMQLTYANASQKAYDFTYRPINYIADSGQFTSYKPSQVFTGNQFNALEILLPVDFVLDSDNQLTFSQINGANGTVTITFWVGAVVNMSSVLSGSMPLKTA